MLSSLAQPHCANGPAHTRACGVLYIIIKVRAVLYTARTRRMHLKEEGREGKEKREGRKLPFKKCNEVEEGRTNKVQSMREPGHASLTEGISNRTAKGDNTRRDDLCGSTCVPPATPAPARQRQRFVVQRYGSYGRMERVYLRGF